MTELNRKPQQISMRGARSLFLEDGFRLAEPLLSALAVLQAAAMETEKLTRQTCRYRKGVSECMRQAVSPCSADHSLISRASFRKALLRFGLMSW